ncbi:MAG: hypothetical protein KatS3mg043_0931 [Rhodothermaceae bacterium]|nr:MAG: hypothetical protein KatS3mg043_0931 [Rhodothermaceae bacterium]
MEKLTLEVFRRVLTPEHIRTFQIIMLALAMGVTLFGVVVLVLYLAQPVGEPPDASDVELIRMLTLGHALVGVAVYTVSGRVYRLALDRATPAGPAPRVPALEEAATVLGRMRAAEIVRLALFEGTALFGLVVCLLGVTNGVMQAYPVYWLNLLSAVAMVGFVARNFPTAERLERVFRAHFER